MLPVGLLGDRVRLGALPFLAVCMPSPAKTASRARVYLLSRSRIKEPKPGRLLLEVQANWRACWLTHAPVGFAVHPAK
jgi:hypothetical protein